MEEQSERQGPAESSRAQAEDFLEERLKNYRPMEGQGVFPPPNMQPFYPDMYAAMPQKSKLLAGVLAFFIPGTGHFYLGLMQKGLMIMLLFILNIAAIPMLAQSPHVNLYPLIIILSCLIPVVYFYNLFDALQSTDQVNTYRRAILLGQIQPPPAGSDPLGRQVKGSSLGVILIAIGLVIFLVSSKPDWLQGLFHLMGSYVGAVILIGAGLLLFVSESRKK